MYLSRISDTASSNISSALRSSPTKCLSRRVGDEVAFGTLLETGAAASLLGEDIVSRVLGDATTGAVGAFLVGVRFFRRAGLSDDPGILSRGEVITEADFILDRSAVLSVSNRSLTVDIAFIRSSTSLRSRARSRRILSRLS